MEMTENDSARIASAFRRCTAAEEKQDKRKKIGYSGKSSERNEALSEVASPSLKTARRLTENFRLGMRFAIIA